MQTLRQGDSMSPWRFPSAFRRSSGAGPSLGDQLGSYSLCVNHA